MDQLFTWAALVSLLSLTVMEIVLGIDNIVFISIVSGKLPKEQQPKARTTGLILALVVRIALLFLITWIRDNEHPIFSLMGHSFSARNLILIAGGLFLLTKSTREIHERLEGGESEKHVKPLSLSSAITQIVLLDVVFSFDSILTAIGIAEEVIIMVAAVIISLGVMLAFSGKVSDFVNKHPSIKMLALSFLLMIGVLLITEGWPSEKVKIAKEYVYFAMAFSFLVEMLNMRARKKVKKPVQLRNPYLDEIKDDVYESKSEK